MNAPLARLRWRGGERMVLLLHGVGGGRASFDDALSGTGRALAEAGFDAVALDLPGYGESAPIDPFTLAGMAASVWRRWMRWVPGAPRWSATAWAAWSRRS